jgi:hypothetical protein
MVHFEAGCCSSWRAAAIRRKTLNLLKDRQHPSLRELAIPTTPQEGGTP